jgi:polyphosphate kinase 2 (PPK2 family)
LRLALGGLLEGSKTGPGILVIMEGPDAAGKGGAIKLMVNHLDPRHYRVVSYGAPSRQEKDHHFLWRFYTELPGLGQMAVFDRSWYGRVLVERIEGFCSRDEWRRAYKAIVDFEESLCTESTILVKMYMHISDDEQLARFESRGADPLKQWKLTEEDWRNREKNREYEKAANEMFQRTDHPLAPWDLISGEQKRWARVEAIETLIRRVEEGMRRWGVEVPEPF